MSQYYEAILQLRNSRKEIVDFIKSECKKNNIRIAKTEKQKNGIDFYLSSKTFALSFSKKLIARFGGKMESSAKLVGRKKDRNLYRVSIIYAASEFQKDDIIQTGNKIIRVKSVDKFICGNDLETRKNIKIEVKGKNVKKLEKYKTSICKKFPSLEVLHPETYQSTKVENPKETKKKTVSVVISNNKLFLAE